MNLIEYKLSEGEDIGSIPEKAVIEAYIVENEGEEALIYAPRIVKWKKGKNSGTDRGCGSLWFAQKIDGSKYWKRSTLDFLNLSGKRSNEYEKKIKNLKR